MIIPQGTDNVRIVQQNLLKAILGTDLEKSVLRKSLEWAKLLGRILRTKPMFEGTDSQA